MVSLADGARCSTVRIGLRILCVSAAVVVVALTAWRISEYALNRPLWAFATSQLLAIKVIGPATPASVGDRVDFEVTIWNVSGSPIRLHGVDLECSCMTVSNDFPTVLLPGNSDRIHVQMVVGEMHGNSTQRRRGRLLVDQEGFIPALIFQVKTEAQGQNLD